MPTDLIRLRRSFHAQPEISGQEFLTAKRVVQLLQECKPDTLIDQLGGTGVLATFDSGQPGPSLLFRAELDALPIQEVNDFAHRSISDGISHKCGHDGHLTILLGMAQKLVKHPLQKGKVLLLFQPAEETGSGAKAVLSDPRFADMQPDWVYALHNLPGYPLHQIVVRKGSFNAAVKSMIIRLNGKTAHAAEPEMGINPALAIAEILNSTQALSNNDPERSDFAVITPVHLLMGERAYGVSAGAGEIHFTIRCWTEAELDKLSEQILQIVKQTALNHHLSHTIEWTEHFYANENDAQAVQAIQQAAETLQLEVFKRAYAFKWGEDFGLFTQKFKGAIFGLGSGVDCPALHNPDYDFPDELIETGVEMFYALIKQE